MPTKSEAFDAIAKQGQDHYDIVTAVMVKHVPVVTGIVGMILVLALGLAWDWWYKRSLRGRTDLSVPAPLESHPDIIEAKREAALEAEVEGILSAFADRVDDAGTDIDALLACAKEIDLLPYRDTKARAAHMVAEKLEAANAPDRAESFHLTTVDLGKREAHDVAARSAWRLATYYRDGDQKGAALTFARKALHLFEAADMPDDIEKTTRFIRELRA